MDYHSEYLASDVVANASRFGRLAEKFWDVIFEDKWFFKPRETVESLLQEALVPMETADAVKIQKKFWECFDSLKEHLHPEYVLEPQKKLYLDTPPFTSYGKLDYFVLNPGEVPFILDAKGSYAKNDSYKSQMVHYAYMYWRKHGIVPKTCLFYLRLGAVDIMNITEDTLKGYHPLLMREMKVIESLNKPRKELRNKYYAQNIDLTELIRLKGKGKISDEDSKVLEDALPKYNKELSKYFPAKASDDCFVCGYAYNCRAKYAYDSNKRKKRFDGSIVMDDGEILI
jgi:hypothetical protein